MEHIFVKNMRRTLAVVLALLCCIAALAESAGPAVINQNTYVFRSPSLSSAHMKVGKDTSVELVAVKGQWAMVKKGNVTAYMNASHVTLKQQTGDNWKEAVKQLTKQPAVMLANDRVYRSASKDAPSMRLSAGTRLNLIAVSGSWALVERGGVYAYTPSSSVATFASLKSKAATVVLKCPAKVYSALSAASASIGVPAGTSLNVLAVMGSAALVEKGGAYGYVLTSALTCEPSESAAQQAAPAQAQAAAAAAAAQSSAVSTITRTAADNYFSSDKYSNEQKCFLYLTKEMGLNTAAACGILASIKRESSFNPSCTTGKYYGLFQWGDGRLSNMKSFCSANGLSYNSVEGQLKFMRYELENTSRYKDLAKLLKTCANTAQAAYDAAYQFCYVYERPGNIVSSSERRGTIARDTYFPKYNQ